jgi:hypothetical protein
MSFVGPVARHFEPLIHRALGPSARRGSGAAHTGNSVGDSDGPLIVDRVGSASEMRPWTSRHEMRLGVWTAASAGDDLQNKRRLDFESYLNSRRAISEVNAQRDRHFDAVDYVRRNSVYLDPGEADRQ